MSKQEIAEYTIFFFPPLAVYMHMLFKILITDWKLEEWEPGKIQTESTGPDMSMGRAQKLEGKVPWDQEVIITEQPENTVNVSQNKAKA